MGKNLSDAMITWNKDFILGISKKFFFHTLKTLFI